MVKKISLSFPRGQQHREEDYLSTRSSEKEFFSEKSSEVLEEQKKL